MDCNSDHHHLIESHICNGFQCLLPSKITFKECLWTLKVIVWVKIRFQVCISGCFFFFKDHSSTPHEIGALICHFCFSVKQITNYHNYILFFLSIIYWFFSRSTPLNATRCGESNTVTAKLIWPSCVSLGIVLFYFNWILKHEIAQFHLLYTHVLCELVRTVLGDRGNKSYFA